jgi:hypothetical protein
MNFTATAAACTTVAAAVARQITVAWQVFKDSELWDF